jgi:hypothetical protein
MLRPRRVGRPSRLAPRAFPAQHQRRPVYLFSEAVMNMCSLLSSRAARAPLSAAVRLSCVRSFSATPSFVYPHSDLNYRALLRNLRLLAGMRRDKKRFNVLVTGLEARAIAAEILATEPALDIHVAGDSLSADFQSIVNKAGADLDSIIITQPFHTLHNGVEEFKAIRKALCDEEGTLGFLWHRALPTQVRDDCSFVRGRLRCAVPAVVSVCGRDCRCICSIGVRMALWHILLYPSLQICPPPSPFSAERSSGPPCRTWRRHSKKTPQTFLRGVI